MKKKTVIHLLFIALLAQACSSKNENSGGEASLLKSSQMPIVGGSVTKEIIIRTNASQASAGGLLAANSYTDTSYLLSADEKSIYSKINQEKRSHLKSISNDPRFQRSDLVFDLAAGSATVLSLPFGPIVSAVTGTVVNASSNALKGYVHEYQRSEYERVLENLNNRKDSQILKLAYIVSRKLGNGAFNDVIVGTSPGEIKKKIASFQRDLLSNSDLSPKDIDHFLNYGNDNVLLGLTLGILSNQIKVQDSINTANRDINETKKLIQNIADSTTNLLKDQKKFFEQLNERLSPEEKEIFLKKLISGKAENTSQALLGLQSVDKEGSDAIVEIANQLEKSHAILKISTQIATDLNLNESIIKTVNRAATITDATKNLLAFAVTGNPLSALTSVASITSLFSKPKPDPRFTAIFENFRDIKISLNAIQNQLNDIGSRMDNIDDGLKAILDQERLNAELIVRRSSREQKYCAAIIEKIQKAAPQDLTYNFIYSEFGSGKNDNFEDINNCFKFLRETYLVSPENNQDVFGSEIFQEVLTNEPAIKKVFNVSDQMNAVYEYIYPYYAEKLSESKYEPKNLLSPSAVIFNSDILLKTSFLLDFAKYDAVARSYSIVEKNQVSETIRKNKLSQTLLESALNYVNTALAQQNILDGTKLDDKLVSHFLKGQANCTNSRFNELECRLLLNPVMRENLIAEAFRKSVGHEYYWAWTQVSPNNPDFLNEKLGNTSLKIVWVGEGASGLFQGTTLAKRAGLNDGAYVQLRFAPEILIPLPELKRVKDETRVMLSPRTQALYDYKSLLENELLERNLEKVLSPGELSVYNTSKIKMVLKK